MEHIKTIGEEINIIKNIIGYTGINEFDTDVSERQSFIKNIENHAIDDVRLLATDVSHIENNFQENTLIRNNKKSNVVKVNFPVQSPINDITKSFYIELKEYNGRVMRIYETRFTAELINAADENEILEAEFDVSDINEGDMGLFRAGAIFVWKIGKEENNGTQQKVSQLVFRRLSSWKTEDIKRTEEIAKSRAAAIRAITVEDSAAAQ